MKKSVITLLVAAATLGLAGARASQLVIDLPSLSSFDSNASDTYSGTGYLGIYPTFSNNFGPQGPAFAGLFGLEYYNGIYSETELEANISALAGATINSATLNFSLVSGAGGTESVGVTSFAANGILGYNPSAPSDLGSVNASGITEGANAIGVTSLLSDAVAADQTWFGLFLDPEGPGSNFLWTFADQGSDAAGANLTINYTAGTPTVADFGSSALLAILGGLGLGLYAWRKQALGLVA